MNINKMKCKTAIIAGLLAFSQIVIAQPTDWQQKIEKRAVRFNDGFNYIGLQQIAGILGSNRTFYSNKTRKAILYVGDEKITVTAFNPFVILGARVLQMPAPTTYKKNDIHVPVKFFIPILKQVLGEEDQPIIIDENRNLPVNIEGVSVEDKANGTLIRIRTLAEFNIKDVSTRYSRRWLYVDILGGNIDPQSFISLNESNLIKTILPVQQTQMLQLSFQMRKEIPIADVKALKQEKEIWLSIPGSENVSNEVVERLKNDRAKWRIDKIIIDPGHGGRDPGTIGHSGTYEKDVVLGIGKRLRDLIEKNLFDVQALMTRENDEYISLEGRTQFANKNEGKLFISIHANWNRSKEVKGAATYFLGLAKTDEALEISQRENAVIKYDEGDRPGHLTDEQIILATMAQNSYNKESQDIAALIQDEIASNTSLRNRGVKQAGFYVMVGASMPNVLVETAFMSNKKEEKWLNTASFQQKIAKAIFESIQKFKKKYEWVATN